MIKDSTIIHFDKSRACEFTAENSCFEFHAGIKVEVPLSLFDLCGKEPSNNMDKCCEVMKKKPAKKYEKETGRKPIVATMACESQNRRTTWLRYGCNAYESKRPLSQPMSFWTEQDILQYIKQNNLSYASVYGDIVEDENGKLKTTGCSRTGCVFCAFGCHLEKEPNRFQRLKETHPKLWDYCMKDWENGGLGMKNVLDYINVKAE